MMRTSKADEVRLNNLISKVLCALKPPEEVTVSQWADKKRKLSPESSAEVGQWRTSRTPYLRDIMDSFNDPMLREISIVASSQVGKSEALNNMIGYVIDEDPASMLFVQPTNIDAKEYSKLRIAPMIRDCKSLKKKVAPAKSRDSQNTVLQKAYPGGILTMCGSGEAHALCSKPTKYIFGDECDRWETDAGGEGDPWYLATARQLTFYNSKAVRVSTPTIKGDSAIEKAFLEGTQEKWETMCPHCGEYSEIVFESVRFEYEEIKNGNKVIYDVKEIYYICPKCGAISQENEIKSQPSKWVAYNPEAYDKYAHRSFWLTSWVSPWATWKSTILAYLQAKDDPQKLKAVYNTRLGKLWEERNEAPDENELMARREDYEAEIPDGVLVLTMGVDNQDNRLEYEILGHGHFGETWSIEKGVIMGRPNDDAVWEALDDVREKIYRYKDGIGIRISRTFIDEGGHYTMEIRQRCRMREGKNIFCIKGKGGEDVPYVSPPKAQKIVIDGAYIGNCWQFRIGVDAGKAEITHNLSVKTPGSRYCHFPRKDDYGNDYFKGLLSEALVYDKKSGKEVWKKIPGRERNENLDCRNYALAAMKSLPNNLDAIEKRLIELRDAKEKGIEIPDTIRQTRKPRKKTPVQKTPSRKLGYDSW